LEAGSGVGCGVGVLQWLLKPALQAVLLRPSPLERTRIFVTGLVTVSVGRVGPFQKTTRVLSSSPRGGRTQNERE